MTGQLVVISMEKDCIHTIHVYSRLDEAHNGYRIRRARLQTMPRV
jgi:hypothetical protein